jgi:hypothetical protein
MLRALSNKAHSLCFLLSRKPALKRHESVWWINPKRDLDGIEPDVSEFLYVFCWKQNPRSLFYSDTLAGSHFLLLWLSQNPSQDANAFTGSIPSDVGALSALTHLDFCRCYNSSKEQTQDCLVARSQNVCCRRSLCSHYPFFCFSHNSAKDANGFSGSIPSDISFLTGLQYLNFCTYF